METITHEPQDKDAWVCICGNEPSEHGFYPCDTGGLMVEPTKEEWNGKLYVCGKCKRMIDQNTLEVVGQA